MNKINQHIKDKEFDKAIRLCEIQLSKDPKNYKLINDLAVAHLKNGDKQKALNIFKEAIKYSKNKNFLILNNAANLMYELGDKINSELLYKQVIQLNTNCGSAYNNLGNLYRERKLYSDALAMYRMAEKFYPESGALKSNLANVLREQGKIKEALGCYIDAIELSPDDIGILHNATSLILQLSHLDIHKMATVLRKAMETPSKRDDALINTYVLISSFIAGRHIQSQKSLIKVVNIIKNNKLEENFEPADIKFIKAFTGFISRLYFDPNFKNSTQKIFHIGESHCLSYAHHEIETLGQKYLIVPKIIFGTKCFHLAQEKNNDRKAILEEILTTINENAPIFFSFGEIDCRADEGILLAHKKNGMPIKNLVDQTITGYVKYLSKILEKRDRNLIYIFGVPAPVVKENVESSKKRCILIKEFNSVLEVVAKKNGYKFVDIYSITVNEYGVSNGLFHCDDHHLNAKALPAIQKLLNSDGKEYTGLLNVASNAIGRKDLI